MIPTSRSRDLASRASEAALARDSGPSWPSKSKAQHRKRSPSPMYTSHGMVGGESGQGLGMEYFLNPGGLRRISSLRPAMRSPKSSGVKLGRATPDTGSHSELPAVGRP